MPRTTPPRPADIAALFPSLRDHTATTTRLHPRPGTPARTDSSIGGPLLWPADEPWPHCDAADEHWFEPADGDPTDEPIPMVPVAQLYRRDVPDLPGHDLMQLLWCPLNHTDHDFNPLPRVFWRSAADVTEVLADPPKPPVTTGYYLPEPCVLHPEQVVEHRHRDLLPAGLRAQIADWEAVSTVSYFFDLSLAPGWKVGGFPDLADHDPNWVRCASCHTEMSFLLVAATGEWATEGQSWRPPEDPPDSRYDPTGITIGRGWSLNIFHCPTSPTHPVTALASM
ncbi:hypothetical protein [Actinoplanes couchii]|uniref:DUF1963 domain-containing protein n=1 Tax=Actinoplanes couchii TaxID=403638 RepID=A0ABQ3XL11_9ACTN|nr:hypothetical protein [Actinoplanes couchii]MDR6319428.1 hypothetical protein [Actinoplanes couchii]GID59181.1 hypothetical protein Aco03nite_075850 [Actinoplanes couchii]